MSSVPHGVFTGFCIVHVSTSGADLGACRMCGVRLETWLEFSKLTLNHAQVLRSTSKFAPGHDQRFCAKLPGFFKHLYEVLDY